jgi:putative NADH-flavin reductase
MMKLVLLGATGQTGKLVTGQALTRGHAVTAIVRAPSARRSSALPANKQLQTVVGDPRNTDILTPILADHDAIISCLGQRLRQDANLLRDSAAAMLAAMVRVGVRRCLVVSQGLLFPSWNPVITLLRAILARQVADSTAMERLVETSCTDWTIVRPPRLVDGGRPVGYRVKADALPEGAWAMQYADLAAFLLDAAEKGEHLKRIVGVASR